MNQADLMTVLEDTALADAVVTIARAFPGVTLTEETGLFQIRYEDGMFT